MRHQTEILTITRRQRAGRQLTLARIPLAGLLSILCWSAWLAPAWAQAPVANYAFSEGAGLLTSDASGNGNTGTVNVGTTIDATDATTGWTSYGGSASVNTATMKQGAGALNLVKTLTTSADHYYYKTVTAFNLTGKKLHVWLYIRDTTALAKVSKVELFLFSGSAACPPCIYWDTPATSLSVGWNLLTADMAVTPTYQNTFNPASVNIIRLDVDTVATSTTFTAGEFIMDNWQLSDGWTTAGHVGNALNFDGANDYVGVNDSTTLGPYTAVSMAAWVYPTLIAGKRRDIIFANPGYFLGINATGYATSYVYVNGAWVEAPQTTGTTVSLNTWSHIAATWDGSSVITYVNGSPVRTVAASGTMGDPTVIRLGDAAGTLGTESFQGRIDDVKIWNRALSPTEVATEAGGSAPTPPNAPTGLSAVDRPSDQGDGVNLSWTVSNSTGVTEQRIYRGTASGGPYGTLVTTITNNATTTYTDTGLLKGTTYYYVIRAYNGTESANSLQAIVTPFDNLAPNAPTSPGATPGNGQVTVNWTPSNSTDVTQQRVYYATTSGGPYTLVTSIANNTTTSYVHTGLTNGTTYYYVIRAFDGVQESANSNQASAVPTAGAPGAPSGLTAVDTPSDQGGAINLAWTPSTSTGVTEQRVYRSTTSGTGYALVTTIANNTTTSYTNSGLTNGTTYYYVIRAWNGTVESANSTQASAAPADNVAPTAPTGLTAVDTPSDAGGSITLTWTRSTATDVTQQRIYRATTSGGPYTLAVTISNNTATTAADTGLTNGTTYYYVIRAFDGTQESANSTQASASPANNTGGTQNWQPSGTADIAYTTGNVGIGGPPTTTANLKLQVTGNAQFNGTVTGTNIVANYQDVAEWVPAPAPLPSGTVVILDTEYNNQVTASTHAYDTKVAGVVSEMPGLLLGIAGENKVKVATTGRVKVKVDATKGAIKVGDLLVTSDKPGVAMRSEPIEIQGRFLHSPGTIIGKALEPLADGEGEILVLLSLQ